LSVTWDIWVKNIHKSLGLLFILGSIVCSASAQTNSDYFKAPEGEAEGVTLDKETEVQTTQSTISNTAVGPDQAPSSLISGLTIEQFEKVLQRNYIGSYLFYKRLSSGQKTEVFASYQENPNPDSVRNKILQVSKR
jgi:hypothetical protein